MSEHIHEHRVPEALAGLRLDQALAQMFPEYSRSRLTDWLKRGEITVDGASLKPKARLLGGEFVRVRATLPASEAVAPEPVALNVAYEDGEVIVIDKPAGLVVHPGAGNSSGTLQNGLLHRWPALAELPRAGLIHRIDKDTTGLLLIAKTLSAHTALTRQLAEREIHREYAAICHGVLTGGGTIDAPIGRHPQDRLRQSVRDDGRPAVTHYRLVERFASHTLVKVMLETGRTHQIRVHFAHQRHPLVGDRVYGGRMRLPPGNDAALISALQGFKRQALHAAKLEFVLPESGEPVTVEAPWPADFDDLVTTLREHAHRMGSA
ncbi:MAG: 23S rRNA pseudouridine(1911/1915/1917) synthase RluD [Pseudomonadota bacterium]